MAPDATASAPGPATTPLQRPARPGPARPRHVSVLIVGAGFAGLGAALRLKKAGRDDFLIIERGHDVGGTWRDNTYPGAACDVPSHLYSYSFAPNPRWTRKYSSQPEIQDYLRRTARASGTLDRFLFGCELEAARWDGARRQWLVTTSRGDFTACILVTAFGGLCEPKLPTIPGIETFAGPCFHSARWNHDVDLTGKRVAVVGTGASAVQIVPEIAMRAAHLDVYQRTAPWVLPRGDRRYTSTERMLIRRVPGVRLLLRGAMFLERDLAALAFCMTPTLLQRASGRATRHLRRQVADPELRRRLTPRDVMGCRRVLLSDDYYPSLARESVSVVTAPICEIDDDRIVAADGTIRETDVLVAATGFRVTDNPAAGLITGAGGRTLEHHWRVSGQSAYKGCAVPGFPNLFMLIGPNTGSGTTSMIYVIESQLNYLIDALAAMDRYQLDSIDVRPAVAHRYNERLQRRMDRTVWASGCSSWYLDAHGRNTTIWPGPALEFRVRTRQFDLDAYRVSTRRAGRADSSDQAQPADPVDRAGHVDSSGQAGQADPVEPGRAGVRSW